MINRNNGLFTEYLKEQVDLKCYYVPCENFEEIITLQDTYRDLKDIEIPSKKIIYSVSVILKLDYDYEVDLFIQNYKGLDNALYFAQTNAQKCFISLEEISSHKGGLLVGICLNGGELEYPLPKDSKIIDFVYGIDYSKVDDFKEMLSNYKVIAWPDELESEFEQIEIEEMELI